MDYKEFRDVMSSCERVVEVHEDHFKIMCDYIKINNIFTLNGITDINLVEQDCLWFNNHCIHLADVESISISEIRCCL